MTNASGALDKSSDRATTWTLPGRSATSSPRAFTDATVRSLICHSIPLDRYFSLLSENLALARSAILSLSTSSCLLELKYNATNFTGLAGLTAGLTLSTPRVHSELSTPPIFAMMLVVPACSAVTSPCSSTMATEVSLLDHSMPSRRSVSEPSEYRPLRASLSVSEGLIFFRSALTAKFVRRGVRAISERSISAVGAANFAFRLCPYCHAATMTATRNTPSAAFGQ